MAGGPGDEGHGAGCGAGRWWRVAGLRCGDRVSYSAKSGGFRAGRVTLRGVSGRARYVTDAGRSGKVSLGRLHRRMFLPGKPPTGVLHIAGRGHDLTFRLSKPRYTGSRATASYTVKPLPGRSRLRAPVVFGDASLTILPNHRLGGGGLGSSANGLGLGDGGVQDCEMTVGTSFNTGIPSLVLVSDSQWDTDDWLTAPANLISTAAPRTWDHRAAFCAAVVWKPFARGAMESGRRSLLTCRGRGTGGLRPPARSQTRANMAVSATTLMSSAGAYAVPVSSLMDLGAPPTHTM